MITTLISSGFSDYELLDSGNEQRLERFGKYILIRPDPQAIWKKSLPESDWKKAAGEFVKSSSDNGSWRGNTTKSWNIRYEDLIIECRLSPFKHTGIFPEQELQWKFISNVIASEASQSNSKIVTSPPAPRNDPQPNVLNLFGYTGVASLVAAKAGAKVTHVDGSYPTIGWARENQKLSGLADKPIRWILDDALKFCERELKRGVKYDAIIMDPPIYGHGPKGEKWDFNKDFPKLMEICSKLLSEKPLFFMVNAYAISSSSIMLENVMKNYLPSGYYDTGELCLKDKSGKLLSTGIFSRIAF